MTETLYRLEKTTGSAAFDPALAENPLYPVDPFAAESDRGASGATPGFAEKIGISGDPDAMGANMETGPDVSVIAGGAGRLATLAARLEQTATSQEAEGPVSSLFARGRARIDTMKSALSERAESVRDGLRGARQLGGAIIKYGIPIAFGAAGAAVEKAGKGVRRVGNGIDRAASAAESAGVATDRFVRQKAEQVKEGALATGRGLAAGYNATAHQVSIVPDRISARTQEALSGVDLARTAVAVGREAIALNRTDRAADRVSPDSLLASKVDKRRAKYEEYVSEGKKAHEDGQYGKVISKAVSAKIAGARLARAEHKRNKKVNILASKAHVAQSRARTTDDRVERYEDRHVRAAKIRSAAGIKQRQSSGATTGAAAANMVNRIVG